MKSMFHRDFFSAVYIATILFRVVCIVIVATFVSVRTDGAISQIFLASIIASIVIMSDVVLRLERIYRPEMRFTRRIGFIIKVCIILVLLAYAISIWSNISYWAYPGFALFLIGIYLFDFIAERYLSGTE